MWDDDKTVRAKAKILFFKHASEELQNSVKKCWKPMYRTLSREPNTSEPLDYEKYIGPSGREDYYVSIEDARGQGYRKSTFKLLEVVRRLIKRFNDNDEFVRTVLYPFTKNLHNDCIIDLEYDSVGLWIRKLDWEYHVSSYNYQNEIAVDALGVLEDKRAVPFLEAVKGQKMEHMNKKSFDKFQIRIEQSLSNIYKKIGLREEAARVRKIVAEQKAKLSKAIRREVAEATEILNSLYKGNEYNVLTSKDRVMNLDVKEFGKIVENRIGKMESLLTAKDLISLTKESAQSRWLIACHLIALDNLKNLTLDPLDPFSDRCRNSEIQTIEKVMIYNLSNYEVLIIRKDRDEIIKVLKLLPPYLVILIGVFLKNFAAKYDLFIMRTPQTTVSNGKMLLTIFQDASLAKKVLGWMG
jgi:hypothetical protein